MNDYPNRIPELKRLAAGFGPDVARVSSVVLDHPAFATWPGSLDAGVQNSRA